MKLCDLCGVRQLLKLLLFHSGCFVGRTFFPGEMRVMNSMEEYISRPDSDRFGFKVARVNDYPEEPRKMVEALRQTGVRLVISRVATDDVRLINALEDCGFRLKDVQVTYSYDLNSLPLLPADEEVVLRDFDPGDKDSLVELTRENLKGFGHYANNEGLSFVDTGEIYSDWVRRCCEEQEHADYIAVAEVDRRIAGFAIFKIQEHGTNGYATSLMGVVNPKNRSRGLIKKIITLGSYWAAGRGLARLEYSSQVTNIPVNRALAAHGCRIVRSETILHCWI